MLYSEMANVSNGTTTSGNVTCGFTAATQSNLRSWIFQSPISYYYSSVYSSSGMDSGGGGIVSGSMNGSYPSAIGSSKNSRAKSSPSSPADELTNGNIADAERILENVTLQENLKNCKGGGDTTSSNSIMVNGSAVHKSAAEGLTVNGDGGGRGRTIESTLAEETFLSPTIDGPNPRAVLDLESTTGELSGMASSNDPSTVRAKPGDLHEFSSNSAAAVTCELRVGGSMSVAEVKEHAIARLQDELRKAHEELKLKDEEVVRLSRVRDRLGVEFEDLSVSLFQEAHKMVREANVNQAAAEKSLKEANLKIEVLQAEVQALKTLVLTSTPSMPNRHLHPHLDVKNGKKDGEERNGGTSFLRGHKRSPSHCNLKYGRENSPPDSPIKHPPDLHPLPPFLSEEYEIDPSYHTEFVKWRENPELDPSCPFLERIYREDIQPCFNFTNEELALQVWKSIEDNSIIIEAVSGKSPFPKRCALLDAPRLCRYKMKVDSTDQWHYISQLCRDRIAAVCDFFCYLRYIQQGLVKSSVHDVYWEVVRLRKQIALARLGIH